MIDDEIKNYISLKQEGANWDFKKEWYSENKKADLLHDIICMSNNLVNKDSYIIIGVDEERDYNLVDVTKDINRKNTQNIVDFIKDKKFAGEIRPIVYVKTIEIKEVPIDVIVIKNGYETPYYLVEKYQSVNANNIYTRIMDTNTPKNRSADIQKIEYLWKKRFRLIESPLERVKYYLKYKKDWINSPDCSISFKQYYKYFPEFVIEHVSAEEDRNGYEYYLFNQYDSTPHWYDINIYYHQTLLASFGGAELDGGRYFTSTPLTSVIQLGNYHNWDIVYKYFIIDTLQYIIHQFYYEPDGDEETYSHNKFEECILIFKSFNEKDEFEKFVVDNWKKKDKYERNIYMPYFPEIEGYNMETIKKEYKDVQILKNMLKEFRKKVDC